MVVDGGRFILDGDGWCLFWVVVSGGGFILGGSGWWWVFLGGSRWW